MIPITACHLPCDSVAIWTDDTEKELTSPGFSE
jgi:hypothetical protein